MKKYVLFMAALFVAFSPAFASAAVSKNSKASVAPSGCNSGYLSTIAFPPGWVITGPGKDATATLSSINSLGDLVVECTWWKPNFSPSLYGKGTLSATGWNNYFAVKIKNVGGKAITLSPQFYFGIYIDVVDTQHRMASFNPSVPTTLQPGQSYTVIHTPAGFGTNANGIPLTATTPGTHNIIFWADDSLINGGNPAFNTPEANENNNKISVPILFQ